MTKEDLFNAMDGIDEKSLVRASSDKKKIKTGSVVSGIVVAVLLCGAAFPFSKLIGVYLRGKIDFESKITEPVPTETGTSATTEPDETVGDVTTEPPFPDDVLFRGSYFYTVDKNLGFGTKYNVAHSFDELKTIFDLFECSEHIVDFSERDFINGTVLVIERLNDGIDDYGITAIGAKTFAPSYHSESITISSVQDKESGPLKKHTTSVIAVKLGAVEVINQVILTENDEPFFSLYRSEMNEISTAMLNVKLYDISTNTIIRDQDALYGTSTQERDYAFRVNSVKGKVFVFFNGKLYEVSEDVFTDGMPEYLLENCCLIFENCATVYVSDIDGDGYDDICGWQRLGFLNATGISVYSPHAGEKVFSLFDYGHYNYSLAGFSSDGSIKVRESVFGRANGRTGELTSAESGITVRWDREQATEPPVYDVKSEYSDFNLPEEMSAKKAWDVLNAKESLVGNNEYVMFDNLPCLVIGKGKNGGVFVAEAVDYSEFEAFFQNHVGNPYNEHYYGFDTDHKWYCSALYLFDFNGDGVDEFCMNISTDSSMKDSGVVILDVRRGGHILEMPSVNGKNYYLYQGKDGLLRIKETKNGNKSASATGALVCDDNYITVRWDDGSTLCYSRSVEAEDIPKYLYEFIFSEWPMNKSVYTFDYIRFRESPEAISWSYYDEESGETIIFPEYLGLHEDSGEDIIYLPKLMIDTSSAEKFSSRIIDQTNYFEYSHGLIDIGGTTQTFYISADYKNIVQIVIGAYDGWIGSEGKLSKKGYYYDVTADREISLKEFLDIAGLKYSKLKEAVFNSDEYTNYLEDFEMEAFDFDITAVIIDEESEDRYLTVSAFEKSRNTFAWYVNELVFSRSEVDEMRK